MPERVPAAIGAREAQPGSSAVLRSHAMKKLVWIVVGVVIAITGLALVGLGVRDWSS
jgi:hypothetical protein